MGHFKARKQTRVREKRRNIWQLSNFI